MTKNQFWILVLMTGLCTTVGCNKQQYGLPDQTQDFAQTVTYNNKVDVVMMVDNSSSMSQYQNKLANEIPGMIVALDQLGMDYRIVVITTDMRTGGNGGQFVGSPKVLSANTPSLASTLSARIKQGSGGSDLERGLESLKTVLSPTYLNGLGAGFLREDALLAVLALSNEDDYSSGSVASYVDFFDTLKPKFKGTTQAWLVNFIGVPSLSSSCSTALDGVYKEPGLRWIELANQSGGRVEAVCDSTLSQAVSNVRQRIVEILTDFHLDREPNVATIVVKINGAVVPRSTDNGWEYVSDGQFIRFHGSFVPTATDRIAVDYSPAGAT